jgi:WD40 repeat protein
MKEHHEEVTQIRFSADASEFVSSSHDGSVILWDATRLKSVYQEEIRELLINTFV